MKHDDLERLLDSVDLDEVELPHGFVDRTWAEIRPIVEAPRRAPAEDGHMADRSVAAADFGELIPLDTTTQPPARRPATRWRLPAAIAAAAAIVIAVILLSIDEPDEVQSIESGLLKPAEACEVLNDELQSLPGGAMFFDWLDQSAATLEEDDLNALASAFGTFLATTDPIGLDEQFRQMRIVRSGLLLASAQRQAGDDEVATASIRGATSSIHDNNEWHVEGPLENCFDR